MHLIILQIDYKKTHQEKNHPYVYKHEIDKNASNYDMILSGKQGSVASRLAKN